MDYEALFTSAKWDILKALAKSKKSPIELAERANTSVSNISQSLRFLEIAGIVKSERIGNRDKGQPRVVYSLATDSAYIILTAKNSVNKKTVPVDDHKKMVLNIWFYDDELLHPFIEDATLALEDSMDEIVGVFVDKTSVSEVKLVVVPKEKALKKELKEYSLKKKGTTKKIRYVVQAREGLQKTSQSLFPIYDPHRLLSEEE